VLVENAKTWLLAVALAGASIVACSSNDAHQSNGKGGAGGSSATAQEISSFGADAKSGTFTLDEFTADGHVSGSMDLMMTEGSTTVRINGRFKAALHDCGPFGSANVDPCTGRTG